MATPRQWQEANPVIVAAKFLRDTTPGPTALPPGFVITKLPARTARGARKPKSSCPGGAASTGYAVQRGKHTAVRNLAARGW